MELRARVKKIIPQSKSVSNGLREYQGYNYAILESETKEKSYWGWLYLAGIVVSFLIGLLVAHYQTMTGLVSGVILLWLNTLWYKKVKYQPDWTETQMLPVSTNIVEGETVTVKLDVQHE